MGRYGVEIAMARLRKSYVEKRVLRMVVEDFTTDGRDHPVRSNNSGGSRVINRYK